MSTADNRRFEELLSRYLDERLTPDEEAELLELLQDPARGQTFRELTQIDREVADHLAMPIPDEKMVELVREDIAPPGPARGGERRFRWRTAAALAAVLLLAVGASFWLLRREAAAAVPLARLEQVAGEVRVITLDARTAARAGQILFSGQGLQLVGAESSAVVLYPDGTRLEVGADTVITELSGGQESGKRVFLAEGFLTAEVAPQPAGQPMVLATPHAEVVVLGTKFSLSNRVDATHVETDQGTVRLTRKSDGQSAEVGAGFTAVADARSVEPMAPKPLPPRFHTARLTQQGYWAATFSSDGKTLVATRFGEGTVELWDSTTGRQRTILEGHAHRVETAVFSPDGRTLATGSADRTVKLWDVATGQLQATLGKHPAQVQAVAFSADGKTLVVLASEYHLESEKTVTLWDVSTRQQQAAPRTYLTRFWALSPDGQTLATASDKAPIRVTLWDVVTGQSRHTLQGFTGMVWNMAFSSDGARLAVYTFCGGGTVTVWDSATGQARGTLRGLGTQMVVSMAFAPDGTWLATGHRDATVRLWDIATVEQLAILAGYPGSVRAVAFGPDGKTLVSSKIHKKTAANKADGAIQLWDMLALSDDR